MNGIMKVLTAILGVMAVIACLATVGIIGYSLLDGKNENNTETPVIVQQVQPTEAPAPSALPEGEQETLPEGEQETLPEGEIMDLSGHVHDYQVSVEKKATCYSAGRLLYTCNCGDNYYVDVLSTGHVADEWELARFATEELDGLRIRKCIYCDEIIAQETIIWVDDKKEEESEKEEEPPHTHQYVAAVEREASCVLAGLRKYTCSCGSFYTEMIPAPGHVASDWTVAAGATSAYMGREQRTCNVCGTVLDSRPSMKTDATSSPSASPSGGTQATTAPTATSTTAPTATSTAAPAAGVSASPGNSQSSHAHSYISYVLKEANCTEKGVRSYVCRCGSEYAESIELDMNNHSYHGVVIPATSTTQGYTAYTCIRCNYSYFDNYSPMLGN